MITGTFRSLLRLEASVSAKISLPACTFVTDLANPPDSLLDDWSSDIRSVATVKDRSNSWSSITV